ncbi:TonB-dependent receptor [Roseomonas aeriglobus]|nr:TonB-dependent receptor [Roseomonas aeriglobus]
MGSKQLLLCASTIALAVGSAMPALARDEIAGSATPAAGAADAGQNTQATAPATEDKAKEVIVRGVRESLARAREKKRKAEQIVDVVEAEDIGKLPNNTVGDVIASVPGISVYRTEGEVNDIQLRGLFGVQTTIGGTPIESGADRVASIADLPADLVKSVEVYKTRTPDQVEGAGSGSVNIEFRKPTEFDEGFFFSGGVAGRYNNQSRRVNQTYTATVNYKRSTEIGDFGIQLAGTVNHNPFLESQARNDPLAAIQQRQVVGPNILPLPTYAPNQVAFFYQTGSRTTPTVSGALSWAPDERTTFTLEGNYAQPTFDRFTNQLFLPTVIQANSTNNLPALSNVVLVPGTNRVQSMTVSPVTQIGPIAYISKNNDSNFLGKFAVTHRGEFVDGYVEIGTAGANSDFRQIETRNRFVNRPTFDVDFASKDTPYPMMNATFRDLDMLDPNQYRFFGVIEQHNVASNRNLFSRADLKLKLGDGFVRRLDFGVRFAKRTSTRQNANRTISNLQIALADMPEGFNTLVPIAEGFGGTGVVNNARWLSYDRFAARANYDKLRQFVSGLAGGAAFATDEPPVDISSKFDGDERSVAFYGTLNYGFNFLFPVKGLIGARVTNDIRKNTSIISYRERIGVTNAFVTTLEPITSTANLLVIEPTATAVVSFTDKFQGRFSYNLAITRPGVGQITPFLSLNDEGLSGSAGNPDLKPERTIKFDASFEYYFGRNALIAVNPFYWKRQGQFASFQTQEVIPEGIPDVLYTIWRPYNAGRGYRRGVETQLQTFFTFLPGILRNFGVLLNYTYVESKREFSSIPGARNAPPASTPEADAQARLQHRCAVRARQPKRTTVVQLQRNRDRRRHCQSRSQHDLYRSARLDGRRDQLYDPERSPEGLGFFAASPEPARQYPPQLLRVSRSAA